MCDLLAKLTSNFRLCEAHRWIATTIKTMTDKTSLIQAAAPSISKSTHVHHADILPLKSVNVCYALLPRPLLNLFRRSSATIPQVTMLIVRLQIIGVWKPREERPPGQVVWGTWRRCPESSKTDSRLVRRRVRGGRLWILHRVEEGSGHRDRQHFMKRGSILWRWIWNLADIFGRTGSKILRIIMLIAAWYDSFAMVLADSSISKSHIPMASMWLIWMCPLTSNPHTLPGTSL